MARISIIDDDVELAEDMSVLLRKEGHTVSTRDTCEGAVRELVKNTPDLLIQDVMFPENHTAGFDLAREIRKTKEIKDLPIILLTGVNQQFPMDFSAQDIDSEWMPVQAFLEKPVRMAALLEKIGELLGRG